MNDNVIVIPSSVVNNERTGSGFISMTLLDDLAVEGNETIELVLEPMDRERVSVQNISRSSILTITDNDRKWPDWEMAQVKGGSSL